MNIETLILKLSIVLVVGFIGSLIAHRLALPKVTGYLLIGILLGPSLSIIIPSYEGVITLGDQANLSFLVDIALGLIALSIGSEFSKRSIKSMGKHIGILTTFEVLFAVIIVFVVMLLIPKPTDIQNSYQIFSRTNIAFALVLASMSASTAPAATLMVMRQYRAYGPMSKLILPITALDDIFGILVFGFFMAFARILLPHATDPHVSLMILSPIIEVLFSVCLGFLIGYIFSIISDKVIKFQDDLQIMSLAVILLSIGLSALINHYLGGYGITTSQLLMNITIGATITNFSKKPEKTYKSINQFSSPIYLLFFTLAGARLDLSILKSSYLLIIISILYILARGTGKILGIFIGAKVTKSPPVVQKYLGFALLPQGGISIGLLAIVELKLFTLYPAISTIILLSILVYESLGPVFAKYAISKANEINGIDTLYVKEVTS
jgi:Kef-type K+ transport system membrane component KefB